MTNGQPTHLDLFSGIGGFALAAQWAGFRTIAFCEIDKYCRKVLAKNFHAVLAYPKLHGLDHSKARPDCNGTKRSLAKGNEHRETFRGSPIFPDIRSLNGHAFRGVTLITGGFPCQPFSVAGKRLGKADDRALWPEMFRVITQSRPAFVLGENVPGIIGLELDNVLSDLEGIGYATRTFVVPACAVDARHRRNRVWIVGHAGCSQRRENIAPISDLEQGQQRGDWQEMPSGTRKSGEDVADTISLRMEGSEEARNHSGNGSQSRNQFTERLHGSKGTNRSRQTVWQSQSAMGRNFDGLPRELDEVGLTNEAKIRATQTLQYLWCDDVAKAFQWNLGRFQGVSEAEVLLAFLCQYEEQSDGSGTQVESRTVALTILRNLWRKIESARSPYQRQYRRQFAIQYSDALRQLPRQTSSLYPQAWSDGSWEDGILRVAHGIPARVDRLKALGNAIVPQLVYQLLYHIQQLLP